MLQVAVRRPVAACFVAVYVLFSYNLLDTSPREHIFMRKNLLSLCYMLFLDFILCSGSVISWDLSTP
jgi:cytochrome c oxidase assembly factor CtaG